MTRFTLVVETPSEPELLGGHHSRASSDTAACSCFGQSGGRALTSQIALELGECGEDTEHQAAACADRVDRIVQTAEPDLAAPEIADEVDQVAQAPADPIEAPHDQDVLPASQIAEGVGELRALTDRAACAIDIDPLAACGLQGVDLQRLVLTVSRDARVADDHARYGA